MCLTAVTRLREDLLPTYQSIKIHSEFEEYLFPYRDHPSYYWNDQTYNSLEHSLLVEMTNNTCVKYSMEPQSYKVVNTPAHKISGWKIISRPLHSRVSNLGQIIGDVQSDIATLAFNNGEQLEYFITELSDFNIKLSSMKKLYILQDLYSIT